MGVCSSDKKNNHRNKYRQNELNLTISQKNIKNSNFNFIPIHNQYKTKYSFGTQNVKKTNENYENKNQSLRLNKSFNINKKEQLKIQITEPSLNNEDIKNLHQTNNQLYSKNYFKSTCIDPYNEKNKERKIREKYILDENNKLTYYKSMSEVNKLNDLNKNHQIFDKNLEKLKKTSLISRNTMNKEIFLSCDKNKLKKSSFREDYLIKTIPSNNLITQRNFLNSVIKEEKFANKTYNSKNKNEKIKEDTFCELLYLSELNKINNKDNLSGTYVNGTMFLFDENNTSNKNFDETNNLYVLNEFHFGLKSNFSNEIQFNNLLKSENSRNKIILANYLLNLPERQWYKESIHLCDTLKSMRIKSALDNINLSKYLNNLIQLYNHFNWIVWALSYFYNNSLLFNKNFWFSIKKSNLPSFNSLDWIKGFEWQGLYIRVQTYEKSKKLIREIKALKYAFREYLQVINSSIKKENSNLLSNEIIFPLMSYSFFGGIVLYVSVAIGKLSYEKNLSNNSRQDIKINKKQKNLLENSSILTQKRYNRTKINKINEESLDSYAFKFSFVQGKNEDIDFPDDYISLSETIINDDFNISNYSKEDLKETQILSKITEKNLIEVFDDINKARNIKEQKFKFLLINIFSLLPDLFSEEERKKEKDKDKETIKLITLKKDYENPKLISLNKKMLKDKKEIDIFNSITQSYLKESNISVYQNYIQDIDYKIIYRNEGDEINEIITKFFVQLPLIQNKELSQAFFSQYLRRNDLNSILHLYEIKNTKEITNTNILMYRENIQIKMKYSIISPCTVKGLSIKRFKFYFNLFCNKLLLYKNEIKNSCILKNFFDRYGINIKFLPYTLIYIQNNFLLDIIQIYLFSSLIKKYFCYHEGENTVIKLAIYERCKDNEILNSTSSKNKNNNMIEIQRQFALDIIKLILLPNEIITDESKQNFCKSFYENISFFLFIYLLKLKKLDLLLGLANPLSNLSQKQIILKFNESCKRHPFLFIDSLERMINIRLAPFSKYISSINIQNIGENTKENVVVFSPKISSFVEFNYISGFILGKIIQKNNNSKISSLRYTFTDKHNNKNFKKVGENVLFSLVNESQYFHLCNTVGIRKSKDENNKHNLMESTKNQKPKKYLMRNNIKNDRNNKKFYNNDLKDFSKEEYFSSKKIFEKKENNENLSFNNILQLLSLENFLPSSIFKSNIDDSSLSINIDGSSSGICSIEEEEILKEFISKLQIIFNNVISFDGNAEFSLFKSNIFIVMKNLFFDKDFQTSRDLINKMKDNFKNQYLFTFNQFAVISFLDALVSKNVNESQDKYAKALIFSLLCTGDITKNFFNEHQFLMLPVYKLAKLTELSDNMNNSEYFKQMFRCLEFKIQDSLKDCLFQKKIKSLYYFNFPPLSKREMNENDFLDNNKFKLFIFNSTIRFLYQNNNLIYDDDFLSYNEINYKSPINMNNNLISATSLPYRQDRQTASTRFSHEKLISNEASIITNSTVVIVSDFIKEILLNKMSYRKYSDSNIILTFGKNDFNQTSFDNCDLLSLPSILFKLSGIKILKIYCGDDYNFVIDSKSNIYSWGLNIDGQCGIENKKIVTSPSLVKIKFNSLGDYIQNISCSKRTTFFLSKNKNVYLCGYNLIYNDNWFSPKLINFSFENEEILQIINGENFILLLTKKGHVYCYEKNNNFVKGLNKTVYSVGLSKIGGLTNIRLISCGDRHGMAISKNDIIYSWGKNDHGQLGYYSSKNEKDLNSNYNISNVQKLNTLEKEIVLSINCGKDYTIFITNKREIYSCGNNEFEKLGININLMNKAKNKFLLKNKIYFPTKVQQLYNLKVIKISCGENNCLAIINDPSNNSICVWAWGCNRYGQLGLGNDIISSYPKPISNLFEYTEHYPLDIASGNNHSLILINKKKPMKEDNPNTLIVILNKSCNF